MFEWCFLYLLCLSYFVFIEAVWYSLEPAQKKAVHNIRAVRSGDDQAFMSNDVEPGCSKKQRKR